MARPQLRDGRTVSGPENRMVRDELYACCDVIGACESIANHTVRRRKGSLLGHLFIPLKGVLSFAIGMWLGTALEFRRRLYEIPSLLVTICAACPPGTACHESRNRYEPCACSPDPKRATCSLNLALDRGERNEFKLDQEPLSDHAPVSSVNPIWLRIVPHRPEIG